MISQKHAYTFTVFVTRLMSRLINHVDVKYLSPIEKGPKIYASNHPVNNDPLFLMNNIPEQVSALISDYAFTIHILRRFLKYCGHISVIQGNGKEAFETALAKLKSGKSLLIFPEGKLSFEDGTTQEPFSGAIRLATLTKAPIIPVGIVYDNKKIVRKEILVNNEKTMMKLFFFGSYAITFGTPMKIDIYIHHIDERDREKARLMQAIDELVQQSAQRMIQT